MKNFIYTVLGMLLLWTGCSNAQDPRLEAGGGLRISISSDMTASRTLFPSPAFTKYTLSFSGPTYHDDVTLPDRSTFVVVDDLTSGSWTVTARGYVVINSIEYAAAEGSKNITVTAGSLQRLNIPIEASQNGDDGFFSYLVSYPGTGMDEAELWIYPFGETQWDGEYCVLTENSSGFISLAPGYYIMSIKLRRYNRTAGRAEVVHIYSNMETRADYIFTDNDFIKTVTLSGTAEVRVNGAAPQGAYINAYSNSDYTGLVGYTSIDMRNNAWSMTIPAFDADTTLYFEAEAHTLTGNWVQQGTGRSETVQNQNITNINLGTININVITLSGTVTVTMSGNLQYVRVNAYLRADFSGVSIGSAEVEGNAWSMTLPAFSAYTTLYFEVEARNDDIWGRKGTTRSVIVRNQNQSNIRLGTVAIDDFINLKGTVDVTVNGAPTQYARLYAYLNQDYSGEPISYVTVDNKDWSMTIPAFNTDTPLYFEVELTEDIWVRSRISVSVTVRNQSRDNIDLGTVNFSTITLSGTVRVTMDGESPRDSVYVNAYLNENFTGVPIGNAMIREDNTWSMTITPFETRTTVYFEIEAYANNYTLRKRASTTVRVRNQGQAGIDLGVIPINFITVSGVVSAVGGTPFLVDGARPPYMRIRAMAGNTEIGEDEISINGSWSMKIMTFEAPTTVSFYLLVDDEAAETVFVGTIVTRDVFQSNVSGIDISGTINTITITGTANIAGDWTLYVLPNSISSAGELVDQSKVTAWGYFYEGQWSLKVRQTNAPLWFIVSPHYSTDIWITTEARSVSGAVELKTEQMIKLQ